MRVNYPFNALVTAMVFVWAAPAVGEYYRYTDSDGVVRFTDDSGCAFPLTS
jgi:hypothetical protein